MTSREIRQHFLDFFEKKGHRIVHSAPVIPFDDPTLLFTNAGMNQFKDVFLGNGSREYKRAADTQKCIRVSGKHNDLEEVGYDTYHHTFFEMLGNWSFGDYYKEEAITWAWEILTEVYKLPKERIFASVYRTDDEAFELWKTKTDINPNHIVRFDEKDNFWEMGDTGPCGPCSEIHINLSDNFDDASLVNAGSPECIEIWNLVFIQYNRDEDGVLHELPQKHVDTGMGFERLCAVMQKSGSNYDTDVFSPLINEISSLSGVPYNLEEQKIPMRVIADHIRTLTFAIADGAVPGNDGRGYVLRRILRRAARYGRKLNLNKPFLYKLVDILVKTMGDVFPEIANKQKYVEKVIRSEEESFNVTLDRGIELFDKVATQLEREGKNTIPGDEVFKLYDTFGFPVDLTNVMAKERNLNIDEEGFNTLMQKQKEKGREATKDKMHTVTVNLTDLNDFELLKNDDFEFTGYDELNTLAVITGHKKEGNKDLVILNKSPFYVEAGGQIDDLGTLTIGNITLQISDVLKIDNRVIHVVENEENVPLKLGTKVLVAVDEVRRWHIMRNHSCTHFLHKAMRTVLGHHVQQAGSYVGPDRLRFDFTHFAKVTPEELRQIEQMVNEDIRKNIPLSHHRSIPFEEAKEMGALMFFGDKYGDKVNVVQFGDATMEFCGGTHVHNSAQIGIFKIVSEQSIASGVRRIEAVTGEGVEKYLYHQLEIQKQQEQKIHELLEAKKKLEKDLHDINIKSKVSNLDNILNNPKEVQGIKVYKAKIQASDMDELKSFGDEARNKIKSGIAVLVSETDDKVAIVTVVTDDLVKDKKANAGKIVGALAKLVGGGGGGRPHLATAGGKDISAIPILLDKVEEVIYQNM